MSFYKLGDSFRWFVGRVADIKDPMRLGRVKVRMIHDQTGELGTQSNNFGITDEDLLWAWPISAIQSASLHWRKIRDVELEGFEVPDWIDAVGLSPTGTAVGTYVYGFYLDGHEQNIPLIFGSYHKMSRHPEPPTDETTGKMLQIDEIESKLYSDIAALARGNYFDEETLAFVNGQSLPKTPYSKGKSEKLKGIVDEPESAYKAEYPYNTTYTTKSGHAIELDDTPSHERLHIWHKSGSYEEIANKPAENGEREIKGRRVLKTKDDSFEVVDRNKNVLIGNNHNVEIANNETIFVGNNQVVDIGANCTITVGKNCNLIVKGHININAAEGITISTKGAGITMTKGSLYVADSIRSGTGVSNTFTTVAGHVVTVTGGIITGISKD
jgi:hypothetical protein